MRQLPHGSGIAIAFVISIMLWLALVLAWRKVLGLF